MLHFMFACLSAYETSNRHYRDDQCIVIPSLAFRVLRRSFGRAGFIFWLAVIAAGYLLCVTSCGRNDAPPFTSPEAEELRWLDSADVVRDFNQHVLQEGDTRFLSVEGLSFSTEFPGLEETPEAKELVRRFGSRRIKGTTDARSSQEHHRLATKASEYVETYNVMLLIHLAAAAASPSS